MAKTASGSGISITCNITILQQVLFSCVLQQFIGKALEVNTALSESVIYM